jgi:hypothetical protein
MINAAHVQTLASRYPRMLFRAAALLNFVAGAAFLFAYSIAAAVLNLDAALHAGQARLFIDGLGAMTLLLGYGYLLAALDPVRYRLCIKAGVFAKGSFVACVSTSWIADVVDDRMLVPVAIETLLAVLFIDFLRRRVGRGAAWS